MLKAFVLIIPAFFAQTGPVQARLHEVTLRFVIEHITAIHHPTGCNATLEYSNDILVAAFITDPLCLPKGVKARTIPPLPRDFMMPETMPGGTGRRGLRAK